MVIKKSNSTFNSGATQRVRSKGHLRYMIPQPYGPPSGNVSMVRSIYSEDRNGIAKNGQNVYRPTCDSDQLSTETTNDFESAEDYLCRYISQYRDVSKVPKVFNHNLIPATDVGLIRTCSRIIEDKIPLQVDKGNAWRFVDRLDRMRTDLCFSLNILQLADVRVTEINRHTCTLKTWSAYDFYKSWSGDFVPNLRQKEENKPHTIIPKQKRAHPRGLQRPSMWDKNTPNKKKRKESDCEIVGIIANRPKQSLDFYIDAVNKTDSRDLNMNLVVKKLGVKHYNAPRRARGKRKSERGRERKAMWGDISEGCDDWINENFEHDYYHVTPTEHYDSFVCASESEVDTHETADISENVYVTDCSDHASIVVDLLEYATVQRPKHKRTKQCKQVSKDVDHMNKANNSSLDTTESQLDMLGSINDFALVIGQTDVLTDSTNSPLASAANNEVQPHKSITHEDTDTIDSDWVILDADAENTLSSAIDWPENEDLQFLPHTSESTGNDSRSTFYPPCPGFNWGDGASFSGQGRKRVTKASNDPAKKDLFPGKDYTLCLPTCPQCSLYSHWPASCHQAKAYQYMRALSLLFTAPDVAKCNVTVRFCHFCKTPYEIKFKFWRPAFMCPGCELYSSMLYTKRQIYQLENEKVFNKNLSYFLHQAKNHWRHILKLRALIRKRDMKKWVEMQNCLLWKDYGKMSPACCSTSTLGASRRLSVPGSEERQTVRNQNSSHHLDKGHGRGCEFQTRSKEEIMDSCLAFLLQTHCVLEMTYVLLGYVFENKTDATKALIKHTETVLSDLGFVAWRVEERLTKKSGANADDCVHKIEHLQNAGTHMMKGLSEVVDKLQTLAATVPATRINPRYIESLVRYK